MFIEVKYFGVPTLVILENSNFSSKEEKDMLVTEFLDSQGIPKLEKGEDAMYNIDYIDNLHTIAQTFITFLKNRGFTVVETETICFNNNEKK